MTDRSTGALAARIRPRWRPLRYTVAIGAHQPCELRKRLLSGDWILTDRHGRTLVRVNDEPYGWDTRVERLVSGRSGAFLAIIVLQTISIDGQIGSVGGPV